MRKKDFYDNDYQTYDRKKTVTGKKIQKELMQDSWKNKTIKMKKLKNLKDKIRFNLRRGGVGYILQTKDKKNKTVTYSSEKSGYTYTRDWNIEAFSVGFIM